MADDQAEILNSWKEIASYLARGVRTVQRWESEMGLPVRRPRGKDRSAVIALRKDIDAWLANRPTHKARLGSERSLAHQRFRESLATLHDKTRQLTERMTVLQAETLRAVELAQRARSNGKRPR